MWNEHIARRASIGIGKESTSGTSVSAAHRMPKESWGLKPMVKKAVDTWGYGVIDERYDSETVQQMTETTLEGIVRDTFFWALLMGTFGTDTPATVSSTYVHAFTRANTNTHPSFTIHEYNPVQSYYSAYSMIEELEVSAEAWDFVKFSAKLLGKKMVSESAPTVTFAEENDFRASQVKVYFADSEAWLAGASETKVKSFKLTITKNLMPYQVLGSDDIDGIFNQHLTVSGDLEALFNSTTLYGLFAASTKKFMRITITNTDITIGSAQNPKLEFVFGRVALEDREKTQDNNDLVMQTMWFVGEFNATDGFTIKANLQNLQSAAY